MKVQAYIAAAYHSLVEIVVFFPLLVVLNHFSVKADLSIAVIGGVALSLIGFALSPAAKHAGTEIVFALVVSGTLCVFYFGSSVSGWFAAGVGALLMLRGFRLRRLNSHDVFKIQAYVVGLVLYLAMAVLLKGTFAFDAYSSAIYWAGVATLFIFFFELNRLQLENAAHSRQTNQAAGTRVVRSNRFWTLFLLAVIFGISRIRQITDSIESLWRLIIEYINRWFAREKAVDSMDSPPPSVLPDFLDRAKEKNAWLEWLDRALYYTLYAVLLIAALYVLYKMIVRAVPLIRKLMNRLLAYLAQVREQPAADAGFIDETEQLDAASWRDVLRDSFRRRRHAHKTAPSDLSGQVRFMYRETIEDAIKQGYAFDRSRTPLETEQEIRNMPSSTGMSLSNLVRVYNEVRYGDKQVESKHLEDIKGENRRMD